VAMSKHSTEVAREEAARWMNIPYPIFKRLAFFAAKHTTVIPPKTALEWLLIDERYWLSHVTTKIESANLVNALKNSLSDPKDRELLPLVPETSSTSSTSS